MATAARSQPSDELSPSDRELFEAARTASRQAYAPYSELAVGAAVRTEHGGVFRGCNVENASYGLTSCAERNAVFAAVEAEGPTVSIKVIAIYAKAHTVSPCGACRQVLAELGANARVLFPMGDEICARSIGDLLPIPFRLEGRV